MLGMAIGAGRRIPVTLGNRFAMDAFLDVPGRLTDPLRVPHPYEPNRRWIDKMANHGAQV